MPSAKKLSSPIATVSGTTSMMVLISQRLPIRMPARRSHQGHKTAPLSHRLAESTTPVLTQMRMASRLHWLQTPGRTRPSVRSATAWSRSPRHRPAEANASTAAMTPNENVGRLQPFQEPLAGVGQRQRRTQRDGGQRRPSHQQARIAPAASAPCRAGPSSSSRLSFGRGGEGPARSAGTPSHRSPSGMQAPGGSHERAAK